MESEKRPWGHYLILDEGPGFKVKRIVVEPGGRLSLQRHSRRAEYWVVVKGRARVTLEERQFDLDVNQSVAIPLGAKHRLENPWAEPLEIIEVQCGDYLGEDDIQRFADAYART
jgi:mannose-6-phosphate isomerase-like protein (cupin superfamily)